MMIQKKIRKKPKIINNDSTKNQKENPSYSLASIGKLQKLKGNPVNTRYHDIFILNQLAKTYKRQKHKKQLEN